MLSRKLLGVYFDIIHFFAFVAFSISSFVFTHVTFIDFLTESLDVFYVVSCLSISLRVIIGNLLLVILF